jgi:predicted RNA-binding protein with PUA-like domain
MVTSPNKKKRGSSSPKTGAAVLEAPAAYVIKSEPYVYSFDQLVADGKTSWDGVRNFEARNTLRAMKTGDTLLYYHSNEGKELVGLARVAKTAYPDPTTDEDWSSVEVRPIKKLRKPVTLGELKAHPVLSQMSLVRRSRISVTPVTKAELEAVLALSETKL